MKNHIEITNFNDPNLDLYARLSEVQLLRYAEPKQGIFVAESPKVIGRALQAGYEPISFLLAHQDLDREAVEILEERIEGKRKLIKKVEYQVTLVTRGSVGKIE